jgi:hypothetical protein
MHTYMFTCNADTQAHVPKVAQGEGGCWSQPLLLGHLASLCISFLFTSPKPSKVLWTTQRIEVGKLCQSVHMVRWGGALGAGDPEAIPEKGQFPWATAIHPWQSCDLQKMAGRIFLEATGTGQAWNCQWNSRCDPKDRS